MPDLTVPVQRVRAFVRDHILEPDAMRGSEQFLRNITDGEGNAITPVDEEEARRQFSADAIQSRAPIRVQSSTSQTPAGDLLPPSVPVSEAPPSSPNVQRAPIGAGTVAPVVTDPGVDWQAKARAEGWAPRTETQGTYRAPAGPDVDPKYRAPYTTPSEDVPTSTPVPNANPSQTDMPVSQTAAPPSPAAQRSASEFTPPPVAEP